MVHHTMVTAAGRALALSLKQLAGPWWLAQHDPYAEAARTSQAAYHSCFAGPKTLESLLFCRAQVSSPPARQACAHVVQYAGTTRPCPAPLQGSRHPFGRGPPLRRP